MKHLSERQFETLLKEYDLLHTQIREYDARIFQIKGWSIAVFSASIALSVTHSQAILLLVSTFASFMFWGLDALYKSFQHLLIHRSLEIEAVFNGLSKNTSYMKLFGTFKQRDTSLVGRVKRVGQRLFAFNVFALYVSQLIIVAILAIGLIITVPKNTIDPTPKNSTVHRAFGI